MTRVFKTVTICLALVALILTGVMPTFASPSPQTSSTYVLSEAQINASYRISNSRWLRVDSKAIDLQPGQSVLTATITPRNRASYEAEVIFVPRLQNNSVVWDVTSATANGRVATAEQLRQMNSILVSSYRRYLKTTHDRIQVRAVEVTETDIIYTYTR